MVFDRALYEGEIFGLNNQALLSMHLDEPAGATTFAEERGLNGACNIMHLSTCPTAGSPGAVSRSVSFSGSQNISAPPLPTLMGQFTLAVWILPTGTDSNPQGIVGHLSNDVRWSYPTLVREGTGIKAYFGSMMPESFYMMELVPDVLTSNTWNHVVLTYGENQDGKGQFDLYVNGMHRGRRVLDVYALPSSNRQGKGFNIGDVWAGEVKLAAYPANPFKGQIDEVSIHPYTFSEAQIVALYRSQVDALYLPFNEPPGAYQFLDTLQRTAASCPNDLVACPVAGVTGRAGQAVEFDGLNDSLDAGVTPAVSGVEPLSLSAWVRTTAAKDQVIVNQRSAAVYNGEYMFGLTAQGKAYWFTYGNSGAAGFSLYSIKAVNDGKWHHVAAVRDENGSAYIYIDGSLDATIPNTDTSKIASLVATNVYVGADIRDHAQYFDGTIDELHLVRRALPATEVLEFGSPDATVFVAF